MRQLLLATLGGAIGAGARHIVNVVFARWLGSSFPWSTLVVNVVGSVLMGVVVALIAMRFRGSVDVRAFLATGILGGFTTFSAFSLDAHDMIMRGDTTAAILYVVASVLLSIFGLTLGLMLTRQGLT